MDRRREAGLASRRVTWLRVTATASSAALIGLLGLAGTSFAAAARHGRRAVTPAKPARWPTTARHLSSRQRGQARRADHVRQCALLPGQPQRPVRLPADAEPAELLREQRHVPVQQPHAADRAHRRRHPDHAHRPVRRPAGHAGLQRLPGVQHERPERHLRHHAAAPGRSPTGPTRSTTRTACRPAGTPTRTWSTRRCRRPPRPPR